MMAFYPAIGAETLPSDFLLRQMAIPGFHVLFQLMIFAALLASGVGAIHALNERVSGVVEARGRPPLGERTSVVSGQSVAVRVCLGGGGRIHRNKIRQHYRTR